MKIEILEFDTNFTVMPSDCNYMGCIFGGHAMSHLDLAAASLCRKILAKHVPQMRLSAVTHKVTNITFHCAPMPGDIVYLKAKLVKVGLNSLVVQVSADVEKIQDAKVKHFADSSFVFVTRNKDKFIHHGLSM